ncbi:VanZ family protein [Chryseomicrobium sp. FSL W7-1435]|uniref:VanZ family protein n=1 Tax=Chryseomicrobium sp. FSL W7-1435 TaxID=2921704 RepID=UPI00315A255A
MKLFKGFMWGSFILYLLVLGALLFVSSRHGYLVYDYTLAEKLRYNANFIPFATISDYIKAYQNQTLNTDIIVRNLGGNLIAFTPFGLFLPLLFEKLRKVGPFLIVFISILTLIEVTQLLTVRGSFDVDDFILNIPSALLGWGIFHLGHKLFSNWRYEEALND